MARVGLDLADIAQEVLLAGFLHLLLDHLAVADDGRERRAQLVAHVGEELALGAVRGLGGVLGGAQLLLRLLALGDVRMGADPFTGLALLQDRHAAGRHRPPFAVGPAQAMVDGKQGMIGHGAGPGFERGVPVLGMDGLQPAEPLVVRLGLPGERRPARLGRRKLAGRHRRPDDRRAGLDQGAEPLLAVAEPAFRPLAVGDVGDDHSRAGRIPGVRGQREEAELELAQQGRVGPALHGHLDVGEGAPSLQHLGQPRLQPGAHVGQHVPKAAAHRGVERPFAHGRKRPVHVLDAQGRVEEA